MLVLTRKPGQSFFIGKHADIVIKVLTNDSTSVRLGIEAPKELLICREEIRADQLDSPIAKNANTNELSVSAMLANDQACFVQAKE